jgi:membrane protein implicated in regulation of membrane protease activity
MTKTTTIRAAEVVAANPGPAVHLAALGILVLVGLAAYAVVRWRRRREAAEAGRQRDAHDGSSASRPSETPRS